MTINDDDNNWVTTIVSENRDRDSCTLKTTTNVRKVDIWCSNNPHSDNWCTTTTTDTVTTHDDDMITVNMMITANSGNNLQHTMTTFDMWTTATTTTTKTVTTNNTMTLFASSSLCLFSVNYLICKHVFFGFSA